MLLISQGIGDKPYTRERNNSIYLLKILNVGREAVAGRPPNQGANPLLSENKKVYCSSLAVKPAWNRKIQNVCLESAIV
jgi:hypothetical protein